MSSCARHFGLPHTSAATIRGDKKTQDPWQLVEGTSAPNPAPFCPVWGGHFLPVTVDFMGSGEPRYYNIFRNDSRGEHTARMPTLSCNSVLSCIHQRSVTVLLCDSTPSPPTPSNPPERHRTWGVGTGRKNTWQGTSFVPPGQLGMCLQRPPHGGSLLRDPYG